MANIPPDNFGLPVQEATGQPQQQHSWGFQPAPPPNPEPLQQPPGLQHFQLPGQDGIDPWFVGPPAEPQAAPMQQQWQSNQQAPPPLHAMPQPVQQEHGFAEEDETESDDGSSDGDDDDDGAHQDVGSNFSARYPDPQGPIDQDQRFTDHDLPASQAHFAAPNTQRPPLAMDESRYAPGTSQAPIEARLPETVPQSMPASAAQFGQAQPERWPQRQYPPPAQQLAPSRTRHAAPHRDPPVPGRSTTSGRHLRSEIAPASPVSQQVGSTRHDRLQRGRPESFQGQPGTVRDRYHDHRDYRHPQAARGAADNYYDVDQSFATEVPERLSEHSPRRGGSGGRHRRRRCRSPSPVEAHEHEYWVSKSSVSPGLSGFLKAAWDNVRGRFDIHEHTPERLDLIHRADRFWNHHPIGKMLLFHQKEKRLEKATRTGEDATKTKRDLDVNLIVGHDQEMSMTSEATVHSTAIAPIMDLAQQGQRRQEMRVEGAVLSRGHITGTEERTAGS
ncbi:hypothetical protein LTR37_009573 [Vermiconidia calcicola]|uniref:Uncharacterized protein n=1 Tax=Vermiconidia calcicola TaxID=1690605 RepID=A0ACC3N885_9PEZI|nr:hypothetical protein LTR37_009573 [Vermiconidia calcicola]